MQYGQHIKRCIRAMNWERESEREDSRKLILFLLFSDLSDSEGLVFDSPEKAKQPKQENSEDKGIQPSSQKSYSSNIISPAKSEAHSSYQGSNSEEDMFADSFEGETTLVKQQSEHDSEEGVTAPKGSQSLRSYVSGDEDVPEEDQVSSPQFRHLTSRDDLEVEAWRVGTLLGLSNCVGSPPQRSETGYIVLGRTQE